MQIQMQHRFVITKKLEYGKICSRGNNNAQRATRPSRTQDQR